MAEHRDRRLAGHLSQGSFTLEPTRPLLLRVMGRALVCAFCAVAGAAGITVWHAQHGGLQPDQCSAAPVDDNLQQTELARTRLALAEESAARAAVQVSADQAAAEAARLTGELRFLRGQGATSHR